MRVTSNESATQDTDSRSKYLGFQMWDKFTDQRQPKKSRHIMGIANKLKTL
jgi:hypothetical protein